MWPQIVPLQRIDHDVNLGLALVRLQLVVLGLFLRRETRQRIARVQIIQSVMPVAILSLVCVPGCSSRLGSLTGASGSL